MNVIRPLEERRWGNYGNVVEVITVVSLR